MVYILTNAKNNEIIGVFSEITSAFKHILQNNPSSAVCVDMVKANKIYVHCSCTISGGHELKPEYIIIPTKIKN